MSLIEQLICDRNFSYLQPYFYNHPYALRCELGIGEGEVYLVNARKRAMDIFKILFPCGADAFIFNYWLYDNSESGEAIRHHMEEMEDNPDDLIENTIESEMERLRFLMKNQVKYRHIAVKDLKTYGCFDDDPGKERRNRIICYADSETEIEHEKLINMQINWEGPEIGLVSFENECILSVYDDRGCDVVFATPEKMKEFYHRLKPYFLPYDMEEMEKRYNG